ncbi:RNA/RNP complex-1-interacting phosphatase-like isoform X2 [Protopterus annectens]|uniref:RNA/RNP complex-1-interacting phosphatase-like isoform X2 n=1 Tax=Protopterus annectens TaxID=7888 RepID=UPI001CFBB5C5|nr:RNA/RNP complex-1-interacting phosphatase-like isoform X2 [Protopterus annectens]
MVKKNTVPEGWRNLKPVGERVPGTRFIAFKVPLKGTLSQRLPLTQKFTPKDLINGIKEQNEELGLVIDLTNTTRYYEKKDLPRNVQYKKLFTVGLELPDDATILKFKRLVRKFIWENANNDKLIGVHCTTGINRTGYMICR